MDPGYDLCIDALGFDLLINQAQPFLADQAPRTLQQGIEGSMCASHLHLAAIEAFDEPTF